MIVQFYYLLLMSFWWFILWDGYITAVSEIVVRVRERIWKFPENKIKHLNLFNPVLYDYACYLQDFEIILFWRSWAMIRYKNIGQFRLWRDPSRTYPVGHIRAHISRMAVSVALLSPYSQSYDSRMEWRMGLKLSFWVWAIIDYARWPWFVHSLIFAVCCP